MTEVLRPLLAESGRVQGTRLKLRKRIFSTRNTRIHRGVDGKRRMLRKSGKVAVPNSSRSSLVPEKWQE